jgi:hypothetical protein
MSTAAKVDAISDYLDRVYSPIAITEGDKVQWPARIMRSEMEHRIRAAVTQLEEIGTPHDAAIQEVTAKLKDADVARREVVEEARRAIQFGEYSQKREKIPWWRQSPEGWWFCGIMLLYSAIRAFVPQTVYTEPTASIAVAALLFVVGFGCVTRFSQSRRPGQSAMYYLSTGLFYLGWGAVYGVHCSTSVKESATATMSAMSGIQLAMGIIALRYGKSTKAQGTTLWNRKA